MTLSALNGLWLPSLVTPFPFTSAHGESPANTPGTSVTSPSLSYTTNDLLIGAAYSSGLPRFSTYTWGNGDTNTHDIASPSALPSVSLNHDVPASAGSTTFGFTTTLAQQLGVMVAALLPANPAVAPTFNATSAAATQITGSGNQTVPLGSYTTVLGDCIVAMIAGGPGPVNTRPAGAGANWWVAEWVTAVGVGGNANFSLIVGFGCSAGQTSFILDFIGGTLTIAYAVGVFSGVATVPT